MSEIKDHIKKVQHNNDKGINVSDDNLDIWINALKFQKSKTLYEEKKLKTFQNMKRKRRHQVDITDAPDDKTQIPTNESNTLKSKQNVSFINMFDTVENYNFKEELSPNERNKNQYGYKTSSINKIDRSYYSNDGQYFPLIESDPETILQMASVLRMLYTKDKPNSPDNSEKEIPDLTMCEIKNEEEAISIESNTLTKTLGRQQINNKNKYKLVDYQNANQVPNENDSWKHMPNGYHPLNKVMQNHVKVPITEYKSLDVKEETPGFDYGLQKILSHQEIKKENKCEIFQSEKVIQNSSEIAANNKILEKIIKPTNKDKSLNVCKKQYKTFRSGESTEYHCDLCNYKTNTRNKITIHIRRTHNTTFYHCNQCDYKAKYSHNLKDHIKFKHEESEDNRYVCDHCSSKFTRKDYLKKHNDAQHEGIHYPCNECNYKAKQKNSLKEHKEVKHEGIRYRCEKCNFMANYKKLLKEHMKMEHDGIQYSCEQCPYKTKHKKSLKFHIESKHEGVHYCCEQCGHSAGSMRQLRHHVKLVHEGVKYWKKWQYNCKQCSFKAIQKRILQEHVKLKH